MSGYTVDIILFDLLMSAKEFGVDLTAHAVLAAYLSDLEALPRLADYMSSQRRYASPGMPGYYDRVKATMPWLFGEGTAPPMACESWNYSTSDGPK